MCTHVGYYILWSSADCDSSTCADTCVLCDRDGHYRIGFYIRTKQTSVSLVEGLGSEPLRRVRVTYDPHTDNAGYKATWYVHVHSNIDCHIKHKTRRYVAMRRNKDCYIKHKTTRYVHVHGNIDRRPSHDCHPKPLGTGGQPFSGAMSQWCLSHARPLHDIQSHLSVIMARGVRIHECMPKWRVTTNVRESWVSLIKGGGPLTVCLEI